MNDSASERPEGVLGALLTPLRLPGRMVTDIETLSRAVLSLQKTTQRHLPSIDDRAGELVKQLDTLQASVNRLEVQVDQLMGLESTIEERMEDLRGDLNKRMMAVEHEVRAMRPPMDQMANDVQKVVKLLPDPNDGPLTRLKDTLSPSS